MRLPRYCLPWRWLDDQGDASERCDTSPTGSRDQAVDLNPRVPPGQLRRRLPATRIINMAYEKMRSGEVDRMRGASINPPRSVSCTAALDMAVRSGRARLTPHSAPTPTGIATPAAAKTTRHIGSNGADMSVVRFDQPPRTPPPPPTGAETTIRKL